MKYIKLLIIFILLTSCAKITYEPTSIKVISEGLVEDGIKLTFTPMSESMYFCGGVNYKIKGGKIFFDYDRTPIQATIMCDLLASSDPNRNLYVVFPFPKEQDSIELIDSSGKLIGKWTRQNN